LPTVPAPPPALDAEGRPTVPWTPSRDLLRDVRRSLGPGPDRRSRRPAGRPRPSRLSRGKLAVAIAFAGAVLLGGTLAVPAADALLSSRPGGASPERAAAPPSSARVVLPAGESRAEAAVEPSRPTRIERAAEGVRQPRPATDGADRVATAVFGTDGPETSSRLFEPEPEPEPEPGARGAAVASGPTDELRESVLALHRLLPDLTAEDVQRVVRNQEPRIQRCYTRAMRREGAGRDTQITLTVDIAPDGDVDAVHLVGDDVGDLHACLEHLAGRWHFPPSRGGARVPIPLSFGTRD